MMQVAKINLFGAIAAMVFAIPAASFGQFAIQESGFSFETPGFLASAGVMAYDSGRHRLAIADEARGAIFVFDLTDGSFRTIEGEFGIESPTGLAYDRAGTLFVARKDDRAIIKVGPELSEHDSLLLDGELPEDFSPNRLTIADNNDLLIADMEHATVCRFDSSGKLIRKFTDNLRHPDGIYIKPPGEIYIADKGTDPVLQFSPGGKFIRKLSRPEDPTQQASFTAAGLAIDQRGWIYTLDITRGKIVRYDPTGVSREEWAPEPPFFPRDIAIDKYDNIYVSESGLGRVLVIGGR